MTVTEYFRLKGIMTDNCGIQCINCPLSWNNNNYNIRCNELESKDTEKVVEIVTNWFKEHENKTYIADFYKKYPNVDIDSIYCIRPCNIYKEIYTGDTNCLYCDKKMIIRCWNKIKEE